MFNYTADSFERLTLSQAISIIELKSDRDKAFYAFIEDQFRLNNFFNVKTSMAKTQNIRKPKDLYKLSFEEQEVKQVKIDMRKLMAEREKVMSIIKKM